MSRPRLHPRNETVTIQARLSEGEHATMMQYGGMWSEAEMIRDLADAYGHGKVSPIPQSRYGCARKCLVAATLSRTQRRWLMRAGNGAGVGAGLRALIAGFFEP